MEQVEKDGTEVRRIDPDFKARWVAALRSGQYQQGYRRLMADTPDGLRYCCLGVACVVGGLEGTSLTFTDPESRGAYGFGRAGMYATLPDEIQILMHIRTSSPMVRFGGISTDLWMLNDNQRLTFAQIADVIEEQL